MIVPFIVLQLAAWHTVHAVPYPAGMTCTNCEDVLDADDGPDGAGLKLLQRSARDARDTVDSSAIDHAVMESDSDPLHHGADTNLSKDDWIREFENHPDDTIGGDVGTDWSLNFGRYRLVMRGVLCASAPVTYLGRFTSTVNNDEPVRLCADTTLAAGQKFFIVGRGLINGHCFSQDYVPGECEDYKTDWSYDFFQACGPGTDAVKRGLSDPFDDCPLPVFKYMCTTLQVSISQTGKKPYIIRTDKTMEAHDLYEGNSARAFISKTLAKGIYILGERNSTIDGEYCETMDLLYCVGRVRTVTRCCRLVDDQHTCSPNRLKGKGHTTYLRLKDWQWIGANNKDQVLLGEVSSGLKWTNGPGDMSLEVTKRSISWWEKTNEACTPGTPIAANAFEDLTNLLFGLLPRLAATTLYLFKNISKKLGLAGRVFSAHNRAGNLVSTMGSFYPYAMINPLNSSSLRYFRKGPISRQSVYDWIGSPIPNDLTDPGQNACLYSASSTCPALACQYQALFQMPISDMLENTTADHLNWNNWSVVYWQNGYTWDKATNNYVKPNGNVLPANFKEHYLREFFPAYPYTFTDVTTAFFTPDRGWSDLADWWLAFNMMGSQRVEVLTGEPVVGGGETMKYVLRTSALSALSVRRHFSSMGADMHFNQDGMPRMVKICKGKAAKDADDSDCTDYWKSELHPEEWQYRTWLWRNAASLFVTLVDHLWGTHFGAGNPLAVATEETLSANHFLRRFMSVFTWNTISVNDNAVSQLAGSRQTLYRASPFEDFGAVLNAAINLTSSWTGEFEAFADKDKMDALPELMQGMGYYADGQLLYNNLRDLTEDYMSLYEKEWCSDGIVTDREMQAFWSVFKEWYLNKVNLKIDIAKWGIESDCQYEESAYWSGGPVLGEECVLHCEGYKKMLVDGIFHVSGYHRQVGGVINDVFINPDYAAWGWKENEREARPRQIMEELGVIQYTAGFRPNILGEVGSRNFSFLAIGLDRTNDAMRIWDKFQQDLIKSNETVTMRNADTKTRPYPYWQMSPYFVQPAVSV